jgi:hypothetical protein
MTDDKRREEPAGGQRNADARTNSGQQTPAQETSSGPQPDVQRAWAQGQQEVGRDTPLSDGAPQEVEGGYNLGTARVNSEDERPWKPEQADAKDSQQTS